MTDTEASPTAYEAAAEPGTGRVERLYSAVSRIEGVYETWSRARGLTYSEMKFYYALTLYPGHTAIQTELCAALQAPKTTVSSLVKTQAAAGRVQLDRAADDRRRKIVSLTPAGRAFVAALIEPLLAQQEDAAEALAAADVEHAVATLTAFADELDHRLNSA